MSESQFYREGGDRAVVEQYFATFRRTEYLEPEKVLLLAVLQDAIDCYRKFSAARDRAGRDRFREAQSWISGADNRWVFGFANICDLLGLDPQYIRRGLLNLPIHKVSYQKPAKREGLRRRAA